MIFVENEETTTFFVLFFCEKTKGFGVPFRKAVLKSKSCCCCCVVIVIVTKEYNLYRVTINPLDIGGGYFSSSSSALRNLQKFLLHSTKFFICPR